MTKKYFIYIASNYKRTVFYTGVTNNIYRRAREHQLAKVSGFTKKYRVTDIIFYQDFNNINEALLNEKKVKGWARRKKLKLIKDKNPSLDKLI